ncbi:MAG TPA: hypothetical protein VGZ47_03500, partial [Gemmataceae bacterium]|nr:hypothetical protein [Gemmataceae bacterium]
MAQVLRRVDAERHADALRRSCSLTHTFYRMYRPGQTKVTPDEIIPVLNQAGVEFVLMGTYAMGGWMSEVRGTDDVDFLIATRHHRKAVRAIQQAFPKLKLKDQKVVSRFIDPASKIVVIDLMKPFERFYREVFENTVPAGRYRIPDLEMALVCKFAAMISPHRVVKKRARDLGDFMDIV